VKQISIFPPLLLMLSLLTAVSAVRAAESPDKDVSTVVIANGPFAGTYTAEGICIRIKDRDTLGSGWKDFSTPPKGNWMMEGGIQVDYLSKPGPKSGTVILKMANGNSGKPVSYDVSGLPVTLVKSGSGGQITFDGKLPDGVRVKVTAVCASFDSF
jgi:hypothetical protein